MDGRPSTAPFRTLVPCLFFALPAAPLPAMEVLGFDFLRPRLEKFFDEGILPE